MIADDDAFREFSEALNYGRRPKRFFTTRRRDDLVLHLVHRHVMGDVVRLAALQANGFDRSFDICNFGFVLFRRIAGGPWRLFVGKGALDVATGRVAVWNSGSGWRHGEPGLELLEKSVD